jgi:hypothetical protein
MFLPGFEYHMFYVSYPFVTHLLPLPCIQAFVLERSKIRYKS